MRSLNYADDTVAKRLRSSRKAAKEKVSFESDNEASDKLPKKSKPKKATTELTRSQSRRKSAEIANQAIVEGAGGISTPRKAKAKSVSSAK